MHLELETGQPIVYIRESFERWKSGDGVRWIADYVVDVHDAASRVTPLRDLKIVRFPHPREDV